MSVESIQRVLVVGAGTMGQQISLQCAAHGFPVVLNDVSDEHLKRARSAIAEFADQMRQHLGWKKERILEAQTSIEYIADQARASEDVDLLIECIPEDVWLKRRVFAQFDELCVPHAIFVTNTSTLLPKELAKHTGRPTQFAALHFHPNVWDANVVDLMPGAATSAEIMQKLKAFAEAIDQKPLVYDREYRGYVINRFLVLVFREALSMAAKGIATPEQIDEAFTGVLNADEGPFAIMDRIGLDTMLSINDFWCKRLLQIPKLDPVNRRNRELLKTYVSQGHLGIKTGRGFFEYPRRSPEPSGKPMVDTISMDSMDETLTSGD